MHRYKCILSLSNFIFRRTESISANWVTKIVRFHFVPSWSQRNQFYIFFEPKLLPFSVIRKIPSKNGSTVYEYVYLLIT